MKFTGERFIPTEQGQIRLEHYHRYAIVLELAKDKNVLDVACGEGYGSAMLSKVAKSVIGVDVSEEAIAHASQTYASHDNLQYKHGSATSLELADTSFDVVVSFETIEHLAEQEAMLDELRRVLRPDGLLIISSPNRPIYSEESGQHNDFHVKELDFGEFDTLLNARFPAVRYLGQRLMMGSVIQPLDKVSSAYQAWLDDGEQIVQRMPDLSDPVYFLAMCAFDPARLPQTDASVVYPTRLDLIKHYVGFAKWAQTLDVELAGKNQAVLTLQETLSASEQSEALLQARLQVSEQAGALLEAQLQVSEQAGALLKARLQEREQAEALMEARLEECEKRLQARQHIGGQEMADVEMLQRQLQTQADERTALESEVVKRGQWALGLQQQNGELSQRLQAMEAALSWKVTSPLREVRRWTTNPRGQVGRYLRRTLKLGKGAYQSLPLSSKTRAQHRNLIAHAFPHLLLMSGTPENTLPFQSPVTNESIQAMDLARENLLRSDARIDLTPSVQPLVSIVIPIYGKIDYTMQCLFSLAEHRPTTPFEVIVVDDKSPDNSIEVLKRVDGIRVIENAVNQGFIRSCNIGARHATGRLVCFLNNDTKITRNWLEELVRTFDEFPGTGLVGSKLVYPNGQLQEAGGIIWNDGSAWNFGRNGNPLLPEFNYAREVDYCSGASIVIPSDLFAELGGFDEHYLPAYCEDSDLALKVKAKGLKVIYQPLSTVIHFEGITSGTDTAGGGAKAYQVANLEKQFARWESVISTYQANGTEIDKAKDRAFPRRALVLDHCTPTPDQDAGSLITFNMLVILRELGFQVTFIPEDNFLYMPDYTTGLQRAGIEVLYAPYVTSVRQHLVEAGSRYDLVLAFRPKVAQRNFALIRNHCPQAKLLFHTVDLHYVRMLREAALFDDAAKKQLALEMKSLELDSLRTADAAIVVSTAEKEILAGEDLATPVYTFPLILDIAESVAAFATRSDIVFVGGFQHAPNVDAVLYFVREVLPLIRQEEPSIRFHVVGSQAPEEVLRLASDHVVIAGFVEDLPAFMHRIRVAVAPMRFGAGIKGKIGSAMSLGVPTVATLNAVEGMGLQDGIDVVVRDDPRDIATAVLDIYRDEQSWNALSRAGIASADEFWGRKSAIKTFRTILGGMGLPTRPIEHAIKLWSSK